MKKFTISNYDLAQNKVGDEEDDVVSLKDQALILFISFLFKDSGIIGEICRIIYDETKRKYHIKKEWNKVELKIRNNFKARHRSEPFWALNYFSIKNKIRYVGNEIFTFLKKRMVFCFETNAFLKNFTFNSFGALNIRKTYERIRNENLSPFLHLKYMCYSFIDGRRILDHFEGLDIQNKEIVRDKLKKNSNDYVLYFWTWEIIGRSCESVEPMEKWKYLYKRKWWLNSTSDRNAMKYLFLTAVEDKNDSAVQYIWVNKISRVPERIKILKEALQIANKDPSSINILAFLLFQVNQNELEDYFVSKSLLIMKNVINSVRWHDLFRKFFLVLQIYFEEEQFLEIMDCMVDSYIKFYPVGISIDVLNYYFTSIPESAREYIIKQRENEPSERYTILFDCYYY